MDGGSSVHTNLMLSNNLVFEQNTGVNTTSEKKNATIHKKPSLTHFYPASATGTAMPALNSEIKSGTFARAGAMKKQSSKRVIPTSQAL